MRISMIAAMANERVIGQQNKMPWHLPAELQYFKKMTMNKPIVMGRKTFDSIGRPLPGRRNIVVSRQPDYQRQDVIWAAGVEQAIAAAGPVEELMIIGGEKIYELFLPRADRLYLTLIDLDVDGDAHFPDYQKSAKWRQLERQYHAAEEANSLAFETLIYDRAG